MSAPFAFDWVLTHARSSPDAPAVSTPEERVNYAQLAERLQRWAANLLEAGVGSGAHVLIALPNSPAAVVASLAVQAVGAVAVEINREWGESSFLAILKQTQARHVILFGRDARVWGNTFAQIEGERPHVWVVHPAPLPQPLISALGVPFVQHLREDGVVDTPALCPPESFVRRAQSPAMLVYTSGSTGTPRAVIQTHANIAANTQSIVEYLQLTAQDRALSILPLFYCYGKSILSTHLRVGGSVFFDHRFMYPRVVMEALDSERCTGFAGVPLTFESLRRQVDLTTLPRRFLRYVTQAGGAMHPDTVRWARTSFAPAQLFVMYGQTEATARLAYLPPGRGVDKAGSIGVAIPGVTLQVVDEQGRVLPPRAEGHLIAQGPNVTPGYFQEPEATADILKDGWLWTGDLVYQDEDGFFFIVGRAKEIMKLAGHRVSPLEIERVLAAHPEVAEAAVVGLPDPVEGEIAAAFVVRLKQAALSEHELRRFCREQLPAFKVPKRLTFVDALPRSAAGKILKKELPLEPGANHGRILERRPDVGSGGDR